MNNDRGFYLGIFIAALLPAVVLPLWGSADLESVAFGAALIYLPAVAITAAIGIPTFHLLERLGLLHWWAALACGFVGGGALCSVFTGFRWLQSGWLRRDFPSILLYAGIGAATALIVWLFWRRGAMQIAAAENTHKRSVTR